MYFAIICIGVSIGAPELTPIPGQADLDCIEIHGVAAGEFNMAYWEAGTLYFAPDVREPLLAPRQAGTFRNIYAPSAVETPEGWRVFYGAWDGVDEPHDRIYSTSTRDFVDFGPRQTVIGYGAFIHVCNVNAFRNADGSFEMMCTAYPDANKLNKPAYFKSPDGTTWNGSAAPYPATRDDLITVQGYDGYAGADINGMNVILREGDALWLYFNNFNERGRLFRATGTDGKHYAFDGPILDTPHYVNDVKRLETPDGTRYLMALHQNTGKLWYALSRDGKSFAPEHLLAEHRSDADQFMVAVGWVKQGNRILGFLYGAGAASSRDRNRIFGRWLQKKIVYVDSKGLAHEAHGAVGPDRQVIPLGAGFEDHGGRMIVYAEDGTTKRATFDGAHVRAGSCYRVRL